MSSAKPTVALDLSNEAISVWHWKGAAGWTAVGNVAPTDPELPAKLADMQRKAGGGAGAKLATAVRIPRTEVMVTRISLSVFEGEAASAQARKVIADMTPYELDDLVYDLGEKGAGNMASVAIVARHTLQEAESFARQNGFEPVYFTTHFRDDEFSREPRFALRRPHAAVAAAWPKLLATAAAACLILGIGYMGVSALTAGKPTAGTGPELVASATSSEPWDQSEDLNLARVTEPLPPVTPGASPLAVTEMPALLEAPGVTSDKDLSLSQQARIKPAGYQRLAYVDPAHGDSIVQLNSYLGDVKSEALVLSEALRDLPAVDIDDAAAQALESALRLADPEPGFGQDDPIVLAALTNPSVERARPVPLQPLFRRDFVPGPEAAEDTAPPPPPPPGLSAEPGEVVPTPQGTIGPEGILVISGRPPVESRARPADLIPPDPLLAFRPKARPDNLVSAEELAALAAAQAQDTADTDTTPDATAEAIGEAVLAAIDPDSATDAAEPDAETSLLDAADPTLSGIRPKQRPQSVVAKAARAEEEARQREEDLKPNAFAVARSPKPQRRPEKIARLAAARAAQDADTQATASTPEQARGTAQPAPGPTANAVASNATERSNFSKSRMSLVGVFGTPNDRRALVRLSSGRYVKVQTGDRVSGWQVSAIGESTLRINRGSRNQVLRMP